MTKPFDESHAKANGYTRADWDAVNSPELTDDELTGLRPLKEAKPGLHKSVSNAVKRRGRPPLDTPKVPVSIRLDPDLLKALKAGGKGWQGRANDLLRQGLGL